MPQFIYTVAKKTDRVVNPIMSIHGSEKIHSDYLHYTLAVEKRMIDDFKPALAKQEHEFGERSEKARILQGVMSVSKDHLLNLVASNDSFFVEDWWKRMDTMPVEVRDRFIVDQIVHLRYFFFIKMVSMIETQLRIITRKALKIDPSTKEFIAVYTEVLEFFGLTSKYSECYNIARLIRNTIHNMGIHTKAPTTVAFKGQTFTFRQSQQVDFFNDELNLSIQEKLQHSIVDIVSTDGFRNCNL